MALLKGTLSINRVYRGVRVWGLGWASGEMAQLVELQEQACIMVPDDEEKQ